MKIKTLKVCVIGGGSSYTPELIEGFIEKQDELPVKSIVLMDIDPGKLEIVGGLARRMVYTKGADIEVQTTNDLEQAVAGANFVINQIRVGGMAARILDEKIPLEFGIIGQETTGPGGFAKALRTIPDGWHFSADLLENLGLIPCGYLNYYYNHDLILAKQRKATKTRGEEVQEIEDRLLEMYKNPDLAEKPRLLEQRGGAYSSKAAVDLISAIANDKGRFTS